MSNLLPAGLQRGWDAIHNELRGSARCVRRESPAAVMLRWRWPQAEQPSRRDPRIVRGRFIEEAGESAGCEESYCAAGQGDQGISAADQRDHPGALRSESHANADFTDA